jgi:hypothetical protein
MSFETMAEYQSAVVDILRDSNTVYSGKIVLISDAGP